MGYDSLNVVHGVTVLVLCISSDHGLYLYQVSKKILNGFGVMERAQFQY